ncbi:MULTISPECIES: hypothetical protein [unclassified Streptomyces]|uniref:hypothetical protein n=1 Tax=unclassified Streptomyces TaxID=2593676 RepID=UPI000978E9A8|nr:MULTISPECIES: hypothetical protein [unclassified Streptomyces]ONI51135.1 hypothetical protein STIB_49460 [Streptomyces sp. IB2014 011-1]RDV48970.1 hypothetical protein DDV98_26665 [Streptomyces sp. IB2014 011-12]
MHMIALRLDVPPGEYVAPADVAALIRVHFVPDDRIEHLWAHSATGSVNLAFFLLTDIEAEALLSARAACQRAIERTPRFTHWRLRDS